MSGIPDPEEGWTDLTLEREALTGEDLSKLHATGCTLVACELSGASLIEADLWRVTFKECRMSGSVFDRARLKDVAFIDCKLDTASLRGVIGERVTISGSVLRETDLTASRWSTSVFLDDDMEMAVVAEAEFASCAFHGSTIERVIGADSLRGIVIDPAQAIALGLRLLDALGIRAEDREELGY